MACFNTTISYHLTSSQQNSASNFEATVPFYHIAVLLDDFGDVGVARAFADGFEELFHDVFASLGFALDLFQTFFSNWQLLMMRGANPTVSLAVLRHHPVTPYSWAFFLL